MSDKAQETPLLELARRVPRTLRGEWEIQWAEDGTPTGHSLAPVGKYLHELADRIESLEAENAGLAHRLESAIRARDIWTKDASHVDRLNNRILELEAENAALKRELERANAFHERLANRLEIRQDPDGSMYDEIDRLRFENAALMERTQIGPELIETIKMCEARAARMMRGEDAGIAPIVSCFRDILSAVAPPEGQK